MASTHAIVIFGCAVRSDGRPSPALARRISYGIAAAQAEPLALVICSGAAGRIGPSEASVMANALIAAGVDPVRLVLDEASRDTLQSAAFVARLARAEGFSGCVVCSEAYHIPRIRLILRVLSIPSRGGPLDGGRGGLAQWLGMGLREAAAIPYDLIVTAFHRRQLLAQPL